MAQGGRDGIAEIPVGAGLIGFGPARVAGDLDAVAAWGASHLVTLLETDEMAALGLAGLGAAARARGIAWLHAPIADFAAPDAAFDRDWPRKSAQIRAVLTGGGRALLHCRGGLGRSGMVAARLLVEMGASPAAAIAQIRSVRPGAIETRAQESWVGAQFARDR